MAKKQGYKARLDESLGERRGKQSSKKQTKKARRDESEGMRKAKGETPFGAVKTMKNRKKKK